MMPSRWHVLAEVPLGPTGKADRTALMAHVVNVARGRRGRRSRRRSGARRPSPDLAGRPRACGGPGRRELHRARRELYPRRSDGSAVPATGWASSSSLAMCSAPVPWPTWRAQARAAAPAGSRPIAEERIHPATGPAPLSLAQERLRFLEQLSPARGGGATTSRSSSACAVGSTCAALQRSFTAILERHQAAAQRHRDRRRPPGAGRGDPEAVQGRVPPSSPRRRGHRARLLAAVTGVPFDIVAGPAGARRPPAPRRRGVPACADLPPPGVRRGRSESCCASSSSATPLTRPAAPPRSLRSPSGTETSRPGSAPLRRVPGDTTGMSPSGATLRGVPALQLPTDGPQPEGGSGPGRGVPFALPDDVAQGILRLSHDAGRHRSPRSSQASRPCSPATPDSTTWPWRSPWRAGPAARPRISSGSS